MVCGYALLGATWLIIKTEGVLQARMFKAAKVLLPVVAFFLVSVSIWTPIIEPQVMQRWFSLPNFYYLSALPILTILIVFYNFYCLQKKKERLPFILTIGLFVFSYIGFCISAWPYIIPHVLPVWEAAAPPSTLKFILVGAAIILPILLIYTLYSYHVFRGKVKTVIHY